MTVPKLKAVIFDWAGTMVDFGSRAPVLALKAAFHAEGVAVSDAAARRDMGLAKIDHVRAMLAAPEVRAAWRAAKGADPEPGDAVRLYAALQPLMLEAAAESAVLIPGAADLVGRLRARGLKIGSCTGYTRAMMAEILERAASQGYAPDAVVCAGETPSGRPSPLMVWRQLIDFDVWPARLAVKVDDAEVGVAEGVAAGCWTVGVAGSGNAVGLSQAEYRALTAEDRARRLAEAARRLSAAGADFVIETVADLEPVLAEIEARLVPSAA